MGPFPVELWRQIIQDLVMWDVLSLSATCRVLSTIAATHIYEEVNIDGIPNDQEAEASSNSRSVRFSRLLEESPDITTLVRSLNLNLSRGNESYVFRFNTTTIHAPQSQDTVSLQRNPIFLRLPSFSHLQKLKIYDYSIDTVSCTAICSLPSLETLILECCRMDFADSKAILPPDLGNTIVELSVLYPKTSDFWNAFASLGLQSLTIDTSHPAYFGEFNFGADVISSMIQEGVNKSLTKLVWASSSIPASLIDLLNCSSEIRYLALPRTTKADLSEHIQNISGNTIPKLTRLLVSAGCISIFIQNRPVHKVVVLLDYKFSGDLLKSLQYSSVPVRDLELRQRLFPVDIEGAMQHVPSTLHRFVSGVSLGEEHLPSRVNALSRMPDLRILGLGSCLESLREPFVLAFSQGCPSLQEVVYDGDEAWIKRKNGSWERCFRFISRS